MTLAMILLIYGSPAFLLPLTCGLLILWRYRQNSVERLAGIFTIKPLIATPIWALIASLVTSSRSTWTSSPLYGSTYDSSYLSTPLYWLTLVPGLGLTIAILCLFRHLYRGKSMSAFVLLGCDVVRWTTTFLLYPAWMNFVLWPATYWIGLLLPNLYALVAVGIIVWQSRQRKHVA